MIFKISIACLVLSASIFASDRMYIDEDEFRTTGDAFHIHLGNNMWIETSTVHRDSTGLYCYYSSVVREIHTLEYEKKWKCPYCYNYYPKGQPCTNKDCPSKYK